MQKPEQNEYPAYYNPCLALVADEKDILEYLDNQGQEIEQMMAEEITPEKESFRYAKGKWSVKELLGHCIDAERIFGYRALCIARGETVSLPGFDENAYVQTARFDDRTMFSLLDEFMGVRSANLALFKSMNEEELARTGTANGKQVSVRAIIHIIAGHWAHHLGILEERYLDW